MSQYLDNNGTPTYTNFVLASWNLDTHYRPLPSPPRLSPVLPHYNRLPPYHSNVLTDHLCILGNICVGTGVLFTPSEAFSMKKKKKVT